MSRLDTPIIWPETSSNTEYKSESSSEIAAPQRQRITRMVRMLVIGASNSNNETPHKQFFLPPESKPPAPRMSGASV